jgi:beta-xylosidase
VVEGPWPVQRGSSWYLFYSGGVFSGRYGMGYGTAPGATGPFTKSPANPVLTDANGVFSAGGGSLTTGPGGGDWLVYHGRPGGYGGPRLLRLDRLHFRDDGSVAVDGPSVAAQAMP